MKKIAIILFGLIIIACEDIENCDTNDDRDFMIVRFYDLETQSDKKVGFTIGTGSINYEGIFSDDSTTIVLPLNPTDTTTSFFFISDTSNHQLVMRHDTQYSIFDPKCDPSITFLNLDTLQQTFDSTVVVGDVTNRLVTTNVEIYF